MTKKPPAKAGDVGSVPGLGRSLGWRRRRLLPPVFLPGELYGQRSLEGYRPCSRKRVGHDLLTTTTTINQSIAIQTGKKKKLYHLC